MPANSPQGRPPPATLVLSGQLEHLGRCLGVYALEAGRTAHGRAVWRHERKDRWIAKDSDGDWMVQIEKNVGVNSTGFLYLRDANATYPHQSGVAWEEGLGAAWKAAAGLKCAADPPPATLVLSGELERHSACLGVYVLEAGRTAHGRAVWRHERGDRCIAKSSDGYWLVQEEKNVGVNNNASLFLRDANAAFPHL